jgi:hypothetical protein
MNLGGVFTLHANPRHRGCSKNDSTTPPGPRHCGCDPRQLSTPRPHCGCDPPHCGCDPRQLSPAIAGVTPPGPRHCGCRPRHHRGFPSSLPAGLVSSLPAHLSNVCLCLCLCPRLRDPRHRELGSGLRGVSHNSTRVHLRASPSEPWPRVSCGCKCQGRS